MHHHEQHHPTTMMEKQSANVTGSSSSGSNFALSLLHLAHPDNPSEADRIFSEKVQHREIPLAPQPCKPDARAQRRTIRRQQRLKNKSNKSKSSSSTTIKPNPLSARQKRALKIYDIPKSSQKYQIYLPLKSLWVSYIQSILPTGPANTGTAAKLCAADFHGAELEVVRCRCPSRVGIKGIVIKDTKMAFLVVTMKDEVKSVPKEYTIFRFEIPIAGANDGKSDNVGKGGLSVEKMQGVEETVDKKEKEEDKDKKDDVKKMVFEIHGSNFMFRAADRANKKFKFRPSTDL